MMNELTLNTPKGRISGRSAGDPKSPLVLGIHGWSQRNGWETWKPLMEPIAEAGFFVVSVDMPGWGLSESWGDPPLSNVQAVAAVITLIAGLEKATACLMGKSWGGGIALQTTISHPARIDKLILTAPAFREINKLGAITQPVLLAWAEDDPVIPVAYAGQFISALPDARLIKYKNGGHSAAQKNSEDFAPKAIRFLKE